MERHLQRTLIMVDHWKSVREWVRFMRDFTVANINSQMSDHPITGVHHHPARTAMIRITVHIKHHHHQHQRRPLITMAPRRRHHHHQAA